MRPILTWADKVHDKEGVKQTIYEVAFKPDGTQLIAAAGARVLVYDVAEGDLIQSLKGHKDTVYCVDYSHDGKRFASAGADKTVIIWTSRLEGILKYSHNDPIQCIAYNPVTAQLASCSTSDFGLWSPEQKSVQKTKVSSRIICCAWTNDGQHLALGTYSGVVSIRNKAGEEKVKIERGTSPVWSLSWSPNQQEEILVVADWNRKLGFFQLSGKPVFKERTLTFDPCSVSYSTNGDYLVMGGSDNRVSLWTKEGVRLATIGERESWVWSCKVRPKQNYVAIGCHDGTIGLYQLVFNTVHGLYHDRYAYRENMTDVIIQHLTTGQKARIKCRDMVKKIAIYKDRLAVQLPDRVIIYEVFSEGGDVRYEMHYHMKEKIQKKLDCNLLVVTSQHVILCLEKKLQLYNFSGVKVHEWNLESLIRYIKVIGGPRGREGLLVGLKNGQIQKIFIDVPFPISLIKQTSSVRCLDLSMSRTKLAVVDDQNTCLVYDLKTGSLLYQEPNANSVAWNSEMEDMLCFSGNGNLNIKVGNFPVHQQKMQGFVVGFKGSKVFCLNVYAMNTLDVSHSTSLARYLEKKDFESAYKVACLGVTDADWRRLALEALEGLSLNMARKCFIRVRDLRYLDLLNRIEESRLDEKFNNDDIFLGDVCAYEGKFHEAAKLYRKANMPQRAVDMYSDLNMWEYATQIAEESHVNTSDILKRKAQMHQDRNDYLLAASTYIEVGDYLQAIEILGAAGAIDKLSDVARSLSKSESKALSRCVHFFRKHNHHAYATDTLLKLGDHKQLLELHIELQKWEDAFQLIESNPELGSEIHLPYANWLAQQDRFIEAQVEFRKAGRADEAMRVLEQLTYNAVMERRYDDAAYYFWVLSNEYLEYLFSSESASASGENGGANGERRLGGNGSGNGINSSSNTSNSTNNNGNSNSSRGSGPGAGAAAGGLSGGGGLDPRKLNDEQKRWIDQWRQHYETSELYYAFHFVQRYIDEPFTSHLPESLFNIARYILHASMKRTLPHGISRVYTLFALAKQARNLGAFKLARHAFDKLQLLRLPLEWQESIYFGTVTVRSKPLNDKEELHPVCYRCSTTNPLLNPQGNQCAHCKEKFIHSFYSFENLPLIEFLLEPDISQEEAEKLIEQEPPLRERKKKLDKWQATDVGSAQTLKFDDQDGSGSGGGAGGIDDEDPFAAQILTSGSNGEVEYKPVRVNRQTLLNLNRSEVFIKKWRTRALPWQFYRLVLPDVSIKLCDACNHFFHNDDFEFLVLQKQACPFCRTKVES